LVPALLLIFPDDTQEQLTAVSLAVVLAGAISGSLAHMRRRLIDFQTGLMFVLVAAPASFAGAYAVRFVPRHSFDVLFGVFLISMAAFIALGMSRGGQTLREPLRDGRWVVRRRMDRGEEGVSQYAYDARLGLAQSGATGFVAALFGVGGGIMQVPIMATVLRIPLDIAVATSQFMLIFMAAAGTSLHALAGTFGEQELARAALLGAGAIAGSQAGAYLARDLSGTTITRLLAAGLIVVGLRLLLTPVL
ncbi:MAG: sulfite exporter TauE/SafE family protein, partial [Dehalococcoidia bacterium]